MKYLKQYAVCFTLGCLLVSLMAICVVAEELPNPKTYIPSMTEVRKHKAFYDDPRPYLRDFGPKQVLPKDLYSKLVYDQEKMKSLWAEIVGFRAPDAVGKVAPEIKPGKYTYKDLAQYPGLKQLMIPEFYARIKPGAPPFGGNIPEFEVIPTRQYYWALPVAETTEQNKGKTKLDKNGYLMHESWEGGYPFPRPSGRFKAQQVMYNVEKRYLNWGANYHLTSFVHGYKSNLKADYQGLWELNQMRLAGRALMQPYGWFDERAKKNGELKSYLFTQSAPRDIAGMAVSELFYLDPGKSDLLLAYIPSLRRVRKMTSTDTQDAVSGQDIIYDDGEGWSQKLSPTRYPYKFEVIDEREYLVPAPTMDGAEYISSKGLELRNVKMERRPIYVIKLTQLDRNYVYGHRILYVDKETFLYYHIENYDQKGRLYRTWSCNYSWFPEMGALTFSGSLNVQKDALDQHTSVFQPYLLPAFWSRPNLSIEGSVKQK